MEHSNFWNNFWSMHGRTEALPSLFGIFYDNKRLLQSKQLESQGSHKQRPQLIHRYSDQNLLLPCLLIGLDFHQSQGRISQIYLSKYSPYCSRNASWSQQVVRMRLLQVKDYNYSCYPWLRDGEGFCQQKPRFEVIQRKTSKRIFVFFLHLKKQEIFKKITKRPRNNLQLFFLPILFLSLSLFWPTTSAISFSIFHISCSVGFRSSISTGTWYSTDKHLERETTR